jgi:hypothetical protein
MSRSMRPRITDYVEGRSSLSPHLGLAPRHIHTGRSATVLFRVEVTASRIVGVARCMERLTV